MKQGEVKMISEQMLQLCEANGYYFPMEKGERGLCAVADMVCTVGLLYGIDKDGLQGRYCFEGRHEAVESLIAWDGAGDPPGNWIKHKGRSGEYSNPDYVSPHLSKWKK